MANIFVCSKCLHAFINPIIIGIKRGVEEALRANYNNPSNVRVQRSVAVNRNRQLAITVGNANVALILPTDGKKKRLFGFLDIVSDVLDQKIFLSDLLDFTYFYKEQETRAIGKNEAETSKSHGSLPEVAESSENSADGDANQNTENNSDDNSGRDSFQTLCRSKRLRNSVNQPNPY